MHQENWNHGNFKTINSTILRCLLIVSAITPEEWDLITIFIVKGLPGQSKMRTSPFHLIQTIMKLQHWCIWSIAIFNLHSVESTGIDQKKLNEFDHELVSTQINALHMDWWKPTVQAFRDLLLVPVIVLNLAFSPFLSILSTNQRLKKIES